MVELFLRRRPWILAILIFFLFISCSLLQLSPYRNERIQLSSSPKRSDERISKSAAQELLSLQDLTQWTDKDHTNDLSTPKKFEATSFHPIQQLTQNALQNFQSVIEKQSKSLKEAVTEYRRRYKISPPPHFDKWFEFAQKNGVQLVDEFDTISDLITPFWGLKPKTLRNRAKEALSYDNGLIGVAIRDHRVAFVEKGPEWQQNATVGMLQKFLPYLPDMNLAFNMHDEPRVVVPHDDLTRLVQKARQQNMPAANSHQSPLNDFTSNVSGLGGNKRFEEIKQTRFNSIPRQATWTHSRISCSPDSPARSLEDDDQTDEVGRYLLGDVGLVYNNTAMTDICLNPSLSATHGFFDRPNVYKVVHDLFPIFSQSKISSYNDLIYPSPWYWHGKVTYNQTRDKTWEQKQDSLYWRGSTTGGYSRHGGWRRQHRQHVVQSINSRTDAKVMTNSGVDGTAHWASEHASRAEYSGLIDVHFSHVGQCDPGDCTAQKQFFNVTDSVDLQDSWKYKHLLDMDGNAFSGRFYAFLQSSSQVFKLALFREWHEEWLKPWLHFVPLSMQGNDWLETMNYYSDSGSGSIEAKQMAQASQYWANKALRKVDMEAWFFRLLLEYARVTDDNREIIGFNIASAHKKLPHNG